MLVSALIWLSRPFGVLDSPDLSDLLCDRATRFVAATRRDSTPPDPAAEAMPDSSEAQTLPTGVEHGSLTRQYRCPDTGAPDTAHPDTVHLTQVLAANVRGPRDHRPMEIQLSMVLLEVRDLAASIEFYRRLGLDIPDPPADHPIVVHRMGSGVSLLLTTTFASAYDPAFARPSSGYQQLLEFYVGDDALVDSTWSSLTSAGYHGRMPPTRTAGPYAAMVDDPDGNVVLLTSDEAASPGAARAAHDATGPAV